MNKNSEKELYLVLHSLDLGSEIEPKKISQTGRFELFMEFDRLNSLHLFVPYFSLRTLEMLKLTCKKWFNIASHEINKRRKIFSTLLTDEIDLQTHGDDIIGMHQLVNLLEKDGRYWSFDFEWQDLFCFDDIGKMCRYIGRNNILCSHEPNFAISDATRDILLEKLDTESFFEESESSESDESEISLKHIFFEVTKKRIKRKMKNLKKIF
jgi:hypothetical protein